MTATETKEKVLPYVGKFKWTEVSEALDPKPRGVEMAQLHADMLTDQGHIVRREEELHIRSYDIVYDKSYVLQFLLNKFYLPLNLVRDNGEFNLPLRQEILEEADEYAQDSSKREKEADLNRRASALAAKNAIPFEDAKELIEKHDRELNEAIAKLAASKNQK